jgi:glycosyltransferase involved in cell wall biosynthesis
MENGKPHIILIAYHFPPGQEIGGLRPYRFYKYLKRMGYGCYVITATKQQESAPEDVIYVPDEAHATREGRSNARNSLTSNFELLIRKLFFPGHIGLVWAGEVTPRCRQIRVQHPEQKLIVLSTFPPLGVVIAGLIVKWRERLPWVADFRDPVEIGRKVKHSSSVTRFSSYLLERAVFRKSNVVVANVPAAAAMLASRYPWAQSKLHVIWNGFDPEEQPRARPLSTRREKVVVHAGELYLARNPGPLVESLSRLRRTGAAEAQSVRILLLGPTEFRESDLNTIWQAALNEGWVQFRPAVPKSESQQIMEEADGLLLIQPQTAIQVPGKLFQYICIGRPILALVPPSSAVEFILARAGVPYVCLHTDDRNEDFDRKLLEYLRLPPEAIAYSEWFEQNFNAEYQTKQLAAILENL